MEAYLIESVEMPNWYVGICNGKLFLKPTAFNALKFADEESALLLKKHFEKEQSFISKLVVTCHSFE